MPPAVRRSQMANRTHTCPVKGCNYRTPHAKNMDLHRANTGHGTSDGKSQWKGDKQFKGKKK